MQAVEHRQGCQGNPDASRCLHRPEPASSSEDRYGGGGCASAVSALRGPCGRHGCVGSDWPPRAARCRAPDSNNWRCSSADRGRSGCTAGPGRSTVRTGTSGRNRPCAPRGPKPKVLDGLVPASHTLMAPPYSARCRARHGRPAATRWTAAAPDYFGIAVRCTARGSACVTQPRATGRPRGMSPAHEPHREPHPRLLALQRHGLRLHGRPPGGHAGEELTGAVLPSRTHRPNYTGLGIRVLTAE